MNFFEFKTFGFLTPTLQIILIVILFVWTTLDNYKDWKKTGKIAGLYPMGWAIHFAPIYEEIIFRGFILSYFLTIYSVTVAVIASSALFGIWHLKNITWNGERGVIKQILYAGVVFGPLAALLTIWSGSIWPAVIIHYAHNLLANTTRRLFHKI